MNEKTPFNHEVDEPTDYIFMTDNAYKFYTLHEDDMWFMQRTLSLPDQLAITTCKEPYPASEIINPLYIVDLDDMDDDWSQILKPQIITIEDEGLLKFKSWTVVDNWTERLNDLVGHKLLIPPTTHECFSELKIISIKPKVNICLNEFCDAWDSDEGKLEGIPINQYCCSMQIAERTLHFPLRYVNRGPNYIQPISGTIAIQNGVGGSIAFAYDYKTNKIMCEFMVQFYTFKSRFNLVKLHFPIEIAVPPERIRLYSDS
jgi:hypothetical protein